MEESKHSLTTQFLECYPLSDLQDPMEGGGSFQHCVDESFGIQAFQLLLEIQQCSQSQTLTLADKMKKIDNLLQSGLGNVTKENMKTISLIMDLLKSSDDDGDEFPYSQ